MSGQVFTCSKIRIVPSHRAMQIYFSSIPPVSNVFILEEEEFNIIDKRGLGEAKAKVKRSSIDWCGFNCLIKRAAVGDRKTNANLISSLVSSEARREKRLARTEGGLGAKGEAPAPSSSED